MKKFNIINKNGITLKTANTYVNEDINIRLPEKDNLKLIPENIRQGVNILGVEGTVIVPEGTYSITANGSYDIANYATANVNVPIPEGYIIPEGQLDITANGTYDVTQYASTTVNVPIPEGNYSITANGDYDIAQYSTVHVNVPIPEGYIVPEGQLDITENGVHDVTSFATVNVNVAGSGGEDYLAAILKDTLEIYKTDQEIPLKQYAFSYLHNLDTIDAPIISFEQYAFYECYASTLVFRKDSVIPMKSSYSMLPVGDFSEVGRVFVPYNLVDSYKSATNWSSYSSIIYPISSYNPIAPKIIGIEKIRYGDTWDPIQYNHHTSFSCTNSPATTIVKYKINVPEGSDGKFGIYLKSDSSNYHTTYLSKLDTEFNMEFGEIANKNDAVIKTTSSQGQTYIYKGVSVGEHFVTVASTLSANTVVTIFVDLISRP